MIPNEDFVCPECGEPILMDEDGKQETSCEHHPRHITLGVNDTTDVKEKLG
jgi:hypothetical protein